MKPRAMGIVAFEGDDVKVEGLSKHRPMMSISFLGRYRLMDFAISNLTNSQVDMIHLYVKEKPRSVFEHVGTGRHYNINSKQGKLRVMYGEEEISSSVYNTDVRAFLQNESFIWEDQADYVIIVPTHFLFTQDYREVLDHHIESGVDVTVLYKNSRNAKEEFVGASTLNFDKEKMITDFGVNRGQAKQRSIMLESYVMSKEVFFRLIKKADELSKIYWFKDVLEEAVKDGVSMMGYPVMGTVLGIHDLKSYYDVSMSMINPEISTLMRLEWPIYTRTNDSPPAVYAKSAKVHNVCIANGAYIKGEVSNSIIGRNVIIEEGAVVKDSIILPNAYIGPHVKVTGCVVDKHVRIEKIKELNGSKDDLIYINRHDKI